jgi:AcrR family transcriptional regulator
MDRTTVRLRDAGYCSTPSGPRSASILTRVSVTFSPVDELPVIQEVPSLRADAARNRDKVLAAAARLFAEHGPTCVTMDAVAAEAGVGKGTVFRGFGDRAGLVMALLDEHERRFQEDVLAGDPPLGPGAPPVERLIAFGARLFRHYGEHGDLIAAAESSGAAMRYGSRPFGFYRLHVQTLVREAAADADWEYLADALLAAMRVDHVRYLQRVREMPDERVANGWADLVRRLLSAP